MVLIGEGISIMAGIPVFIIFFSIFVLGTMGLIGKKKVWKWYLIFPMFFLIAFFRMEWAEKKVLIVSDVKTHIEGNVNKVVEKEGYRQIYLYGASAGENEIIRLTGIILNDTGMKQELLPGDKISCDAELKQYAPASNPGNFDARRYYASLNIDYYAWTDDIRMEDKSDNLWIQGIFLLKKKLLASFEQISVGEDAGIYSSILLGEKSLLDSDIKKLYQVNGMAHILAISGLHVSILGLGFYKLLRKCSIPFLPCFLMSFVAILSYGIMTGNSVSTVRAIIMFLMGTLGDVLGRTYDILSGLGLSAVMLILIFPQIIYNSGFWLSFLAVFGIVAVKPVFDSFFCRGNFKKKVFGKLLDAFHASLAVTVTTLPIILNSYFEVPVYSVFLNLFVIPLMTCLMVSAAAGGIVGIFCVPAGAFLIGMAHYILTFYEWICNAFMKLPSAIVILGKPSAWQIVIYYLLLALAVVCVHGKRTWKIPITSICAAVMILTVRNMPDFMVRMLDVGQGESIHVSSAGVCMLVDGGSTSNHRLGEYCLIPYLKFQGIRHVDYMVMTHADEDHISGLLEIMENEQIKVNNLILPDVKEKSKGYMKMEDAARNAGIDIHYIHSGMSFACGKITVKCLYPFEKQEYDSENDYSTVLLLSYDGLDLLLTGDIGDKGENEMLSGGLLKDVDILKAAHHGSRYSTSKEFLKTVLPEITLISCGANNSYGHPHEELLIRLEEAGSSILTTPEYGAITIEMGKRMKVYGYKNI